MAKKIILVFPLPRAMSAAAHMVGRIPYSLLYLERTLRDGYEVEIFDERTPDFSVERLLESAKDAVCVGVTVFTGYQVHAGLELSRRLKLGNPGVPVVWGGWHPTLEVSQVISEASVDYAVIGQGETSFRELADHLASGQGDINEIRGVAHKRGGGAVINKPREMASPDSFPQVNLDKVDCGRYFFKTDFSEKCAGLFSSHGCPFHCGFCSIHNVYGRRWFPRQAENVLREMAHLKEKYGVDGITFDDDNFFVDKNFTIKLLNGFIDNKLGLKWAANAHSSTFLKMADRPFLDLLKKSGCSQILIGAETGNPELLEKIIGKHASVKETYEFVALLEREGITAMLSTMVGFPYGDGSDYKDTISMIAKCKKISPTLRFPVFFYTPYPGTALYSYAIKNGFKPPEKLEDWGTYSLTGFKAPWVSADVRRFMRNFNSFYAYYSKSSSVFFDRNPVKIFFKGILYLIVNLRFKLNFFRFQVDAEAFYLLLRLLAKFKLVDLASGPWADF